MNDSPIARLLNRLPHQVAKQKRKEINDDLSQIGMVENFRQTVLRDRFDISRTQPRVMQILMKHLDLEMDFFTTTDEAKREEAISKVVRKYYEGMVSNPLSA